MQEPRQLYGLGSLVRKITRPIKKAVKGIGKIAKSPLGKTALLGALGAYGLGALGSGGFNPLAQGFFSRANLGKGLGTFFSKGNPLFFKGGKFNLGRAALTGLGATAIAAPFLMGGDEEEEVDEESFTGPISSIESIRDQARQYYADPTNSALYFMPPKSAVRSSFYAADGGLADIPRGGYEDGESVVDLSKDPNYKGWLKLYETNPDAAEQNENHAKYLSYYNSSKNQKAEGGIMDLGGMEKDYREGGFVPIGAEERADDVPARLSKNEFVFTADAVRNAGGGDIDKGAEVMQNMMDNLEAGGTISEESQGEENPAQAMFDQAQMLEGRLA